MYEIIIVLLVLIIIKYTEIYYIIKKLPNKIKIAICKNSNILIIKLIRFLNKKHLKIIKRLGNQAIDNPNKYEVLSPNEKSDINGYSEMLQIAFKTPGTNNIAITGSYGSGKSSFLRTFENRYKEWDYLHISLATFEEAKNMEKNNVNQTTEEAKNMEKNNANQTSEEIIKKEKQHQLIERSILQQIFYKEKDKTIPFSRFKRIINIKKSSLIFHSILLAILILYSVTMLFPLKVEKLFTFDLKSELKQYSLMFWLIPFITIYYFYKIIQYFTGLKVSKFNIKSGEFQIDNKDKTSILNEHLDEILYFFEVTSYNVVIIEDLDRFDSTEIFIKLRELNTLINNSKDINRRIRFVYAIRDDMFKDKDRTKFFEFIVPIIPYINSNNSFLKLKEKFKKENISEDFLRNVALRINDMRLLLNISNEYKIYKYKINSNSLSEERLLAMIIYKNFYPLEFAKLHINEGNVAEIFNKRIEIITLKVKELASKIKEKQTEINEYEAKIEDEKSKSIDELRMVYILNIFKFNDSKNREYILLSDGSSYYISNFKDLLQNEVFYKVKNEEKQFNFKNIENEINNEYTYNQREEIILNQNNKNLENLKQDLRNLKDKENKIKKYTISEIAKEDDTEIFKNIENEDLLKFLLRDGYIREDEYHNYISYFFKGGLSYKDREFVLSVKDDKPLNNEYELINKKEVLIHLTSKDFEVKAILNYSLLDYIIENNIKDDKFDNFISVLVKNEECKDFIFNYINFTNNLNEFINIITDRWVRIWFYIYKESQFTEDKKAIYFRILFDHLGIKLINLNIEDSLKEYIETSSGLPEIDKSNDNFEKLIYKLKVKYKYIEDYKKNPLTFDFIYKNDLYCINKDMISIIVKSKTTISLEELNNSHYSSIQKSELNELRLYIKQNINEYIENVFLQIETNTQEDEEYIMELLNNEDLEFENKQSIIKKEETIILNISKIEDKELWEFLFRENKITANWKNILYYYQYKEQQLNEIIIDFISNKENYKQLSNNMIYNEEEFEEKVIENLSLHLITFNELNDECYSYITKSLYRYSNLLTKLTNEKIDILLKNNKLGLTQENINYLKEHYSNKQIVLFENLKEDLLKEDNKFTLDENDYIEIFKSTKFSIDEKMTIINKLDLNIFDNEDILKLVINIYLEGNIEIPNELLSKLFDKVSLEDSLKLLIKQIPKLEEEQIKRLLVRFAEPYDKLSEQLGESFEFENTEINKNLLTALKNKGIIKNMKLKKKEIVVCSK
ncbi:hypothetical protein ACN09M_03650 [Aliarcobacter butzleri]|uniref:YobI family P-loop NTPase n=1 Tax=Aliarcobacter butzleri TaxID=28197 RepID=UPI003AECBC73